MRTDVSLSLASGIAEVLRLGNHLLLGRFPGFKVTLPLLRSSLLSGAIFAFIISFSDINLALFLSGPQSTSLPVHLFSQLQWQGDPTIAPSP